MKELFKEEFENSKVDKEIVASMQKKKEHKLIGQQRVVKGHRLFKYNTTTKVLSQNIKYKKTDLIIKDFSNIRISDIKTSVEVEEGYVYVQALKPITAISKLEKMGYDVTGIKYVK